MRLIALLAALAAGPALAGETRDAYECSFLQACAVGQACVPEATGLSLAFVNEGLDITMGGVPVAVEYDADLRTAAFRHGSDVVQLRLMGDGGGVAIITPEFGSFEDTRVLSMHCSPA